MPEAGDLHFAREPAADGLVDALRRRILTNVLEQPHDVGVRAAMQRALQRANRADDGRVQIGQGGSGDPRGERRRVELVIGEEHQRLADGSGRGRIGGPALGQALVQRGLGRRQVLDVGGARVAGRG